MIKVRALKGRLLDEFVQGACVLDLRDRALTTQTSTGPCRSIQQAANKTRLHPEQTTDSLSLSSKLPKEDVLDVSSEAQTREFTKGGLVKGGLAI